MILSTPDGARRIGTEEMRKLIIPIFVVYKGCPNRCVFCNERITAGTHPDRITETHFRDTVDTYLKRSGKGAGGIQIAFYGGNFTGIDGDYQEELLSYARSYIREGTVGSVRVSTRPDYIDEEVVDRLRQYDVTTVELGAQSFIDEVLDRSRRGHSARDVVDAVMLLKDQGFETGLHLMAGLPGDTKERFYYTVDETVRLKPDTVRIHPTVIFKETALADSYRQGTYHPLSMEEAVALSKYALVRFTQADIRVIRIGLQMTAEMEEAGTIVAGPHHPAFRSLVDGSLFFDMAAGLLKGTHPGNHGVTFIASPHDVNSVRGLNNRNIHELTARFHLEEITVKADPDQQRNSLVLEAGAKRLTTGIECLYPANQ